MSRVAGIGRRSLLSAGNRFAKVSGHDGVRHNRYMLFCGGGFFRRRRRYDMLEKQPLVFDYRGIKEITARYNSVKKKYTFAMAACTVLFVSGIVVLGLTDGDCLPWSEYHAFVFLFFALGLCGLICFAGICESYDLLVNNDKHVNSLGFRLKQKIKNKIDEI